MSFDLLPHLQRLMPDAAGEIPDGVVTYQHVTPYEDEPQDHEEGGCACQPYVDEATRTVFHRPIPRGGP